MPTVFILQENPQASFEDAKRFGDIEVILVGQQKDSIRSAQLIDKTLQAKWNPEDYLVPNGSPLYILAAGAALASLSPITVNTLIWDRRTLTYEVMKLNL